MEKSFTCPSIWSCSCSANAIASQENTSLTSAPFWLNGNRQDVLKYYKAEASLNQICFNQRAQLFLRKMLISNVFYQSIFTSAFGYDELQLLSIGSTEKMVIAFISLLYPDVFI